MTAIFDENYWNDRYSKHERVWSGNPNPQLLAETSGLAPRTALDAGCGEGADSIWLAEHGWHVTGVDISTVALEKAAAHAATHLLSGSITWEHHDFFTWSPTSAAFDLVSAQFMHLPKASRDPIFSRLADAVTTGGTLLIVGHSPSDADAGFHQHFGTDLFFTAEQLAAALDPEAWEIVTTDSRPRKTSGRDGESIIIHDEVLRARRNS
ncbi:class I SAM-dependent methyltransferase [Arthrobacter antibioticus]|uniref:class I SAM-dependent methyltransferase n=1 Tax=Arthrobacter sp. H35-MC1 TaxID=3046203 RepID=UPI0024B8BC3F|nr:class I SAM-dependent methyltransferase [Arthrobacter sp. H35-MC1]MDJ0318793.1 methyltransferase domain-containing protein [Arthrobacter sp. H35-MC1]